MAHRGIFLIDEIIFSIFIPIFKQHNIAAIKLYKLNFPIKLTNKLGHLNRLVTLNDFSPTNQDLMVKNELSNLIQVELNKYENLIENDLKKFNKEFSELELDYLILKK